MSEFVKIKIIDEDNKVLMHHFIRADEWGLPAGKIDEGETALQAAVRELLERTGYQIAERDLKQVGTEDEFLLFQGEKKDMVQIAQPGERGGYQTEIQWE